MNREIQIRSFENASASFAATIKQECPEYKNQMSTKEWINMKEAKVQGFQISNSFLFKKIMIQRLLFL